MLVRGVVGHEIEQQAHAPRVQVVDERVEVRERAEQRIDILVVRHVVAEVGHRRRKMGDSQTASTPSQCR